MIHPLVLLISYTFVFSVILPQQLGPENGTNSFAIFLLCGLLPWILFNDTVIRNCSVISDNAPLITKTIIPAEILPISITISNLVHHMIGLGILLGVMLIFHTAHFSALWVLLYMAMLLMFAQGLGWIVAGLHVFLRDTIQAIQIVLLLWFWFTLAVTVVGSAFFDLLVPAPFGDRHGVPQFPAPSSPTDGPPNHSRVRHELCGLRAGRTSFPPSQARLPRRAVAFLRYPP